MFWLIDSCQNSVSADQYCLTVSPAQVSTHRVQVFFEVICWQVATFQMIIGSSSIFLKCIWNKSCLWVVCYTAVFSVVTQRSSLRDIVKFWFRTDLGRENSTGFLIHAGKAITFDFSHCHALITLYVQFLCSDWSKIDRWVHAENLCSVWKIAYW